MVPRIELYDYSEVEYNEFDCTFQFAFQFDDNRQRLYLINIERNVFCDFTDIGISDYSSFQTKESVVDALAENFDVLRAYDQFDYKLRWFTNAIYDLLDYKHPGDAIVSRIFRCKTHAIIIRIYSLKMKLPLRFIDGFVIKHLSNQLTQCWNYVRRVISRCSLSTA